ncbi:MAG: putative Co/Zn/Cd efflux system rane fusion protein [Myxococcaceae bacterium]|nr:putative Co/Zn/Cd efflux system rane fusion protein [Myxococcaceae bacterium]
MLRYVVAVLLVLVVIGSLAGMKAMQIGKLMKNGKQMEQAGPPPEAVATAPAQDQSWDDTLSAVGSVASDRGVALSNDAPGLVTRIRFESGAVVKKGQVLVELDTNLERAQLASAVARKSLAATTYGRTKNLVEKAALPQAQLDNDEAQLKTAITDADAIQAQIAKKTIRAPFAGRLGIRAVNLGQYLNAGTPVAVLETVEAVHVDFTLPQQRLADVTIGMPVRVALEADVQHPFDGTVAAVDPALDPATRAIKIRADVPNRDERLRPGMFVEVTVLMPHKTPVVTVPATAIQHAPYGDSVYVVEDKKPDAPGMRRTPDGKPVKVVRQQFVRVGSERGDFIAVLDGVKPGDEVVTAGGFKLRNGSPVFVDPAKQPTPKLEPRPENR